MSIEDIRNYCLGLPYTAETTPFDDDIVVFFGDDRDDRDERDDNEVGYHLFLCSLCSLCSLSISNYSLI